MSAPPPRLLPRAIDPRREAGSFGERLLLPFRPDLWTRAASWSWPQLLVPLLLALAILVAALGCLRVMQARAEFRTWASRYDESWPAVVVENGQARVEGDRVIRWVEPGTGTFLVDPLETVPLEAIETPAYVVIRKTTILRREDGLEQVTRLEDLQRVFGDPLRVDGASLAAFDRRWGLALVLGVFALVLAVQLGSELVAGGLYGLFAAGLAFVVRGRGLGLDFGACWRVALACWAPLVVLDIALNLLGATPGFCLGVVLWPALLTALATWRLPA